MTHQTSKETASASQNRPTKDAARGAVHTPGPWAVCPKNKQGTFDIEDANGHYVAISASKEDADRIGSAPELLSELKHMVFLLKHANYAHLIRKESVAAIARAEGRQP